MKLLVVVLVILALSISLLVSSNVLDVRPAHANCQKFCLALEAKTKSTVGIKLGNMSDHDVCICVLSVLKVEHKRAGKFFVAPHRTFIVPRSK